MLLVVDVGNTQTHFGTFRGRRARRALALRHRARVDRRRARRGAAQPARAARRRARRPRRLDRLLDGAAAASPSGRDGRALPRPPHARRRARACKTGMPIRYDNPREIGADRLVNAVAAYDARRRRRASCVDFGTAITYDVVSAEGEYLGGIIAPGRRDLDGGADRARGAQAAADRPRRAALADRQVDGRRDPLRRRLRLRRPRSTASCAACATSSGPRRDDDRHRRPGRAHRALHRGRSTRSTTCSR